MPNPPIQSRLALVLGAVLTCAPPALADPVYYVPSGDRVRTLPSNVLLIVADDVGVDKVGVYDEHPDPPPTPSIDALASRGVLFRNAYSYPACSPTRASFLTGRHAWRTGVGQIIDSWKDEPELEPEEMTIPEMLRLSGSPWSTSLAGKWHLSSMSGTPAPLGPGEQGFGWYAGTLGNLRDKWPDVRSMEWGYTLWNKNTNGEVALQRGYITSDTVDDAIERIEAMPEPWFLLLSFHAAHLPLHVPPGELHTQRGLTSSSSEIDLYDASVEAMDTEIGRLMETIASDVLDRTTVVFIGDNGTPDFGIRAPWDPARSKGTLFEGGVNVPMIVAGPQVSRPGSETAALTHTVDIFATVADIAGVEPSSLEQRIDGVSFLPALQDPSHPGRALIYTEDLVPLGFGPFTTDDRALRDATHKLLRFTDGREELYDLGETAFEEGTDLLAAGPLSDADAAAYEALSARMDDLALALQPEP